MEIFNFTPFKWIFIIGEGIRIPDLTRLGGNSTKQVGYPEDICAV